MHSHIGLSNTQIRIRIRVRNYLKYDILIKLKAKMVKIEVQKAIQFAPALLCAYLWNMFAVRAYEHRI